MITCIRTASILPGKTFEAVTFARQIAKHLQDKHGVTFDVLMPIGGNPSRIAWHSQFENLAAWETLTAAMMADMEYMTALAANSVHFLPGSLLDEFWRTV